MLRAPCDREPESRMASRRRIFPGPRLECSAKSILKRTTGAAIEFPPGDIISKASPCKSSGKRPNCNDPYLLVGPHRDFALCGVAVLYMVQYNESDSDGRLHFREKHNREKVSPGFGSHERNRGRRAGGGRTGAGCSTQPRRLREF